MMGLVAIELRRVIISRLLYFIFPSLINLQIQTRTDTRLNRKISNVFILVFWVYIR